jgi:SAM-dependent methyltransferase
VVSPDTPKDRVQILRKAFIDAMKDQRCWLKRKRIPYESRTGTERRSKKLNEMNLSTEFLQDIDEGERRLSGKDLAHFRSRVEKAAHILAELAEAGVNPQSRFKILFAGSGVGFIPYILARHTAWQLYGGDLNPTYLYKYSWIRERVNLSCLDVTAMPFPDSSFDVVVYNHVVEHVLAWEELASESCRIIKKDGLLYLATPNLNGLYRPDVPLRVFFRNILFRKKQSIPRETRILLHMGLSLHEIERLLAQYSDLKNLNRAHVLINCPAPFQLPFSLVPTAIYRHFAPNHVVIARK